MVSSLYQVYETPGCGLFTFNTKLPPEQKEVTLLIGLLFTNTSAVLMVIGVPDGFTTTADSVFEGLL
ncbi:hypothetical protein D3C72_1956900 [compost metagenome]